MGLVYTYILVYLHRYESQNGDGTVDLDEFRAVMRIFNIEVTREELLHVANACPDNRNPNVKVLFQRRYYHVSMYHTISNCSDVVLLLMKASQRCRLNYRREPHGGVPRIHVRRFIDRIKGVEDAEARQAEDAHPNPLSGFSLSSLIINTPNSHPRWCRRDPHTAQDRGSRRPPPLPQSPSPPHAGHHSSDGFHESRPHHPLRERHASVANGAHVQSAGPHPHGGARAGGVLRALREARAGKPTLK
eukprot:18776-Prorocentrum_minimum.AAC.3